MGLTEYRKKRNFQVTSEPKGGRVKSHKRLRFVVQKHDASHLHYDFRLELGGVLKSWAVPKGPSLDPANKRLAMHVEDHPLEYGDFEGIIPQGEYGGGTVLLWDHGTWVPVDNGNKSYRDGSLKFVLHGEKLQGHWMLVRRGGRRGDLNEKHWFLFKERDEFARPDSDIASEEPLSVTTGRDLKEIAEEADRVWGSKGDVSKNGWAKGKAAAAPPVSKRKKTTQVFVSGPSTNGHAADVKARSQKSHAKALGTKNRSEIEKFLAKIGTKRASMGTSAVQLARLAKQAPDGDNWIHEIKFDGYRMLCRIADGKARFISRNGKDWTKKFSSLSAAAAKLPISNGLLDGEVVVLEPDGKTSFQALQNAFQAAKPAPFWFYVFDLLFLNGRDIKKAPLEDRKALLQRILPNDASFAIRYSDHVTGNGPEFFAEVSRLGLEGIISKRLGRPYVGGRGPDWLKVKCALREEFVIAGFTKPSGSRQHFGALLLGYYDKHHELNYAGRVGTGFDARNLASLYGKFLKVVQKQSSFKDLSGTTGQARGVTWLNPSLVAQVQFSNWTDDGQLRHPAFLGLREDKAAKDMVREQPVSPKIIESSEHAAAVPKAKMPRRTGASSINDQTQSEVAGVHLSHPDKLLYPDDDITKLDLARYYEQVASWMLPHVENRLLSLVRCPAGSGEKCFFQKHPGEGTSEALRRFDVTEKNKTEEYLALYDLPGLISLVQLGVLEIHSWGSQADQFEKPDRLIFDLDPDPSVDWPHIVTAAKEVRLILEELDLESFIKTTGGKGLHIVVPVRRRLAWDDAKKFCKAVADFMVAAAPDRYIAKMTKAARKGKIFVDYLRNDRGATSIAPYSTRNRSGAPVSVPIGWDELVPKITSDHYNIHNLPARLAKLKKDPWADIGSSKQTITASMLRQLRAR
jgi:bifunctional non-homologous end joining protein LigD